MKSFSNIQDTTSKKSSYAWERLNPKLVLNDSASQKLLKIHLDRYQTVAKYVGGRSVLDIACGVGYGTQILSHAGASTVVGVDICPDTISYAKLTYQDSALEFICANAEQFEYPKQFDCVVSFETIEHLPHPEIFLNQVRKLLISGGTFFLSTPLGETRHFDPHHLQAFSQKDILGILENNGFTIDWYRIDECFLNRSELLEWKRLYPESSISNWELLLSWRGLYMVRDWIFRGGFNAPQLLVASHLNSID